MSLLKRLAQDGHISPPKHLLGCPLYEVVMGSWAFGTSSENSDYDIYGFFIQKPGPDLTPLEEFRAINLLVETEIFAGQPKEKRDCDIVLYSLATFFERCMDGKSQSLETLFVSDKNIVTMSEAARLVRTNRHRFLHRGTATAFQAFAREQIEGMVTRRFAVERRETIERFGFDLKAAYHSVRLLNEARQLLREGTLDLMGSRDMLLEIRKGQWSEQKVVDYCAEASAELDSLWNGSPLPDQVDKRELDGIFASCLALC